MTTIYLIAALIGLVALWILCVNYFEKLTDEAEADKREWENHE
jgi:archaellum component FlaF (FlaF/FlaG flagellin family)